MRHVRICFLWHMHQPYYSDPVTGSASMPWVRLHASKAYFDMAFLLERFPGIRATFNFTPSLLLQLQELASGSVRDLFLEHTQRPAAELSAAERAFLLRHFFSANWATMVRPYPRYHELLVKRGTDLSPESLDRLTRQFSSQELLDLQVWHNLAWFGYGAVARYPRLATLRSQGRGFTEEDKLELLSIQGRIVSEVIPLYRRLADSGQIELTTTPFYHPILPLLIDTEFAKRPRPDTSLPARFQAPADAEAQIQQAVAFHASVFGRPPAGLWPSEGAVCPELIPLLRRAGLRWMASDEGILARSIPAWDRNATLYQPFTASHAGEEITIVFRDRALSDAIGFTYHRATPESAVEDTVRRLEEIINSAPGTDVFIPIILDGENPWEHYHDSGERFLSLLYTHLLSGTLNAARTRVSVETISRALEAHQPSFRLSRLHSGSWINADFKIWLGHPEDNRAWDLLRETRARLLEMAPHLAPDQVQKAWAELYAAEGSDWFWWYGDEFQTEYKPEFDRLFRTHLRNVFILAGAPPPDLLNEPIMKGASVGSPEAELSVRQPVTLLAPTLDGLVTNFFEWHGAGTIEPSPPLGAMWRSSQWFTYIGFGYSRDTLFLRLDPAESLLAQQGLGAELSLTTDRMRHKLIFSLMAPEPHSFTLWSASETGSETLRSRYSTIYRRKIIELAVPFKDLNLQAGQEFKMTLIITQHGLEVERYPRFHPVVLTVPDETFEARMWRV